MKTHQIAITGLFLSLSSLIHAACSEHEPAEQTYRRAKAIGEFRVESTDTYRDPNGKIRTTYQLSLNASLKRACPQRLDWDLPGGLIDHQFESSSLNPEWKPGQDHILHLQQNNDGRWTPMPFRSIRNSGTPAQRKALRDFIKNGARGKAPVISTTTAFSTDSATANSGVPSSRLTPTGYFETDNVPCRFTLCDSGVPIPCIIDIDPTKLPTGVDTAGAIAIVNNVLNAWSEVSSVKFTISATTSFGVGADTISASDQTLRIQLHDTYNRIPSLSVFGIGGGGWAVNPGSGATIAGRTFNRRSHGYVVLNHRAPNMAIATNFAEVLTHEVGHALGLTHSSELPGETEPILKNATMYYTLSADGRGADIKLYDEDRIAFGYPLNTPPCALDRTIRVVTGSPQPTGFGVDRVTLSAFDLQTPGDLIITLDGTPPGFTLSGSILSFACPNYSDLLLSDAQIEGGVSYGIANFQVSDGVNLSPLQKLVVTGFQNDSQPSDGLPDSWLSTYFGITSPGAIGSPRHPDSDPDGDGLNNRIERYLGTHPLQASSGLPKMTFNHTSRILSFTPLRYAPHVVESSANLTTWTKRQPVGTFSSPTITVIDVKSDAPASKMFYRLNVSP